MTNLPLRCIIKEPKNRANASFIGLHGLGADGYDFEGIAEALVFPPEWNVRFIFPHAPQIPVTIFNKQIMRSWYDIKEALPERSVDKRSVDLTLGQIIGFVEDQVESGIASNRIIVAGFSQGGAIAGETVMHCNKPLGGVIMLSTYLIFPENVKMGRTQKANLATPFFWAHGKADETIPHTVADKHRKLLQAKNYNVDWHSYEKLTHAVSAKEIADVNAWIATNLQR